MSKIAAKQKEIVKIVCGLLNTSNKSSSIELLKDNNITIDLFFDLLSKDRYNDKVLNFAFENTKNPPLTDFIKNSSNTTILSILKAFKDNNVNLLEKDDMNETYVDKFLIQARLLNNYPDLLKEIDSQILKENFKNCQRNNLNYIIDAPYLFSYLDRIDLKDSEIINSPGYQLIIKSYSFLKNFSSYEKDTVSLIKNMLEPQEFNELYSSFLFNSLLKGSSFSFKNINEQQKQDFYKLLDENKWKPNSNIIPEAFKHDNASLEFSMVSVLKLNDINLIEKMLQKNIIERHIFDQISSDSNTAFQIVFCAEMQKLIVTKYPSEDVYHPINNDENNFLKMLAQNSETEVKKEPKKLTKEEAILENVKAMFSTLQKWENLGLKREFIGTKDEIGKQFFHTFKNLTKTSKSSFMNKDIEELSFCLHLPPHVTYELISFFDKRYDLKNKPEISPEKDLYQNEFIAIVGNFLEHSNFKTLNHENIHQVKKTLSPK